MNQAIELDTNKASATQIHAHLARCDAHFTPSLSSRLEIGDYADKLFRHALRVEAWSQETLIGLVAMYCQASQAQCAYISNVSVLSQWQRQGIAERLLQKGTSHAQCLGMHGIALEVASSNYRATGLYAKLGFIALDQSAQRTVMKMDLTQRPANA